jgi:hypothetical protein
MLTTKYRNIVFFIFSKYLIFSIVLAFLDNRFKSIVLDNSKTTADLMVNSFHYFIYVILAIIVYVAIFSLPYYFAFKINNKIIFILTISLIFFGESLFYVWFNSPGNLRNGEIDLLVGILTMLLFFFKPLKQKFVAHK